MHRKEDSFLYLEKMKGHCTEEVSLNHVWKDKVAQEVGSLRLQRICDHTLTLK